MMEKVNILGVGISAIQMDDAIFKMEEWIEKNEPHYICVCPVSTIMECQKDERLRDIVNSAGLATPDGMPLVWLSKLNGYPHTERVYGSDLMLAFCRVAQKKGYSNFFYGGANGVPEKLVQNLRKRFPRLKVAGTYLPPFRSLTQEEDQTIIEMINKASPDVIWVGISTPKQDKWMAITYGLVLKESSKEKLVNYLEENLIETRDLLPLVNQPIYKKLYGEDLGEHFSVAKYLNNQVFYIGCHQYLRKDDLDYIVRTFHDYFQK